MSGDIHTANKAAIAPLRAALYDYDPAALRAQLQGLVAPDAPVRFSEPLGETTGPEGYFRDIVAPFAAAWPDLERRDYIVMAGQTEHGADWVGCGGYYTGTFVHPWLDIPPTGHVAHMRFHEFYRLKDGRVSEVQALWDVPEVMMLAGAWPLAPSLGREWHVPGPATEDGIVPGPYDEAASAGSCRHVVDMLDALKRHPSEGGPEVMEMDRYWHPKMSWYGPAGIGTGRGIAGFRNWHQIPFLAGMPDRGRYVDEITYHFFGDGAYVGVTGWPNMIQTLSHGGWLGIAPVGKRIEMRSLDFWRVENGLIRENWVLVDLLHMYRQIGVDVFARLREFNKARCGFDPETGEALA
ncbi:MULTISPECIES: ester cyclase [unclassified Roseitalea]|uniref:ester cyclase n=1 Tax=unclassified Roseitalea TaxID=2639107 RepID=UPI0027401EB3|nr:MULTISPECIES: ester cyclase [unclassified Roseitalea]